MPELTALNITISEAPQRISTNQHRRNSSDSDPLHHRPITDRSPRLFSDRPSPKGTQSDPNNQRKLGTRISDLESQLIQAQLELKNLKHQIASPNETQNELHKKTKNNTLTTKHTLPNAKREQCPRKEVPEETHKETDVYEVPMEKEQLPSKVATFDQLNATLKELEESSQENKNLKKQLDEATSELSSAKLKQNELEKELESSNEAKTELMEKLKAADSSKEELEAEMKKLRVQTEQWRKAADAAALILAGDDVAVGGVGVISERRGSMERHFNSVFEPPPIGGYPGYLGSPPVADVDIDDVFGSGKRKGSGIRMFGDLWKKKNQK
ncbi:hypothetical protein V2J09_012861 [Rumex salicifolius]